MSYAKLMSSVWRDPDWRRLSMSAQRTYMLLISQESRSACGALALMPGKWAAMCADTTEADITADITELEYSGFVEFDLVNRTVIPSWGGHVQGHRAVVYVSKRRHSDRRDIPIVVRAEVIAAHRGRCFYCNCVPTGRALAIDHVVPVVRGGTNTRSNLVVACQSCNSRKGSKMPSQAEIDRAASIWAVMA